MSDGGKGSKPRPFNISQEEYANRFDTIFGKKVDRIIGKKVDRIIVDEIDDKITRNNEETQEVLKQK
jgi:hypothetical protein